MVIYRSVHHQLFRYSSPDVSLKFLQGSVKVTTLKACRNAEKEYFKDEGEGTQAITSLPGRNSLEASDLAKLLGVEPAAIHVNGENAVVTEGIDAIRREERLADAFIFCTSSFEADPHMLKKFGNGCIKIVNPVNFFELLDDHLRRVVAPIKLEHCIVDDVEYAPRIGTYRNSSDKHIAFLKPSGQPKDFEKESEVRAVWIPSQYAIEPIFLNIPVIANLMEAITSE